MKKISIALLALATAGLAASCQKEETVKQGFTPMTINAVSEGIGTATKTEMIYKYDVAWSANDKIYVTDGTSNDTFTLSDGEGTTKGTFTQDGTASFTSEVQVYYPATMVQDGDLVWPAVQTNSQTVPMYSSKTVSGKVEDFNFSSLGSVLQIVFNSKQDGVTLRSIEIKDGTATLSGTFTVDPDGKANITSIDKAGITLDLGEAGVALGNAAKYFNIAVPAGDYQDLTLVFTATDGAKCTMTGGKVSLAHNTVGRLTIAGSSFKKNRPAGALEGEFSVSDSKKVLFSKGNLYSDSDFALHFESDQFEFNNTYESSHVSYFSWANSIQYAASTTHRGYNLFCDESHKVSVDGSDAIYYALSRYEWKYLFNNHSKKWAKVNGKNGYVIAPDGFAGTLSDSYPDDAALAADKLVFLPAAGYRNSETVFDVFDNGYYWSSSMYTSLNAYCSFFNSYGNGDDASDVDRGYSVRLVTDVK